MDSAFRVTPNPLFIWRNRVSDPDDPTFLTLRGKGKKQKKDNGGGVTATGCTLAISGVWAEFWVFGLVGSKNPLTRCFQAELRERTVWVNFGSGWVSWVSIRPDGRMSVSTALRERPRSGHVSEWRSRHLPVAGLTCHKRTPHPPR